jgi:hypothetical protein
MLQSISHATYIKTLKVFKTLKSLPHYWRTTCFNRHWSSSGASKIVVGIAALSVSLV